MLANNQAEFIDLFRELDEFRDDSKLLYPLNEILLLIIAAVLSGSESWRAIIKYGENKLELLRKFLPFQSGVPSKGTVIRIMNSLNKSKFEAWLTTWGSTLVTNMEGELIAIDGKALRGARKGENKNPLYLLNAFATKQGFVIGQQTINKKTNEITAIPELLDTLYVQGSIITVDAIGCQKKVAAKIIEKEADYFLAVKANQPTLFDDIQNFFNTKIGDEQEKLSYHETLDKRHGRIEIRRCYSSENIEYLQEKHPAWQDFNSICCVESERHIGSKKSITKRYYISSTAAGAETHLSYSRDHWRIENNLHWVLDVQFKEDESQIRIVNAPENMGTIRKLVFNLVNIFKKKNDHLQKTKEKTGVKTLRLIAGWNDQVAEQILVGLAN